MHDLFTPARILDEIATDPDIDAAIDRGAYVISNISAGKDSGAATFATDQYLDRRGHPRDRRFCIHADLGRAEWVSTPATAQAIADRVGQRLVVVRRSTGDLFQRWEQRFNNGKQRYVDLATYNLIGPWSSAALRFCTSELKAHVIGAWLARNLAGNEIIQVMGIRREESSNRAKTVIAKPDHRFAKPANRAGTSMMIWNPIADWLTAEVFDCHHRHEIPLHEAYTVYDSSRLSCAFCILQSIKDQRAATRAAGNVPAYLHLVTLEAFSTFSFQPDRWLADVAPSLLSPTLAEQVRRAKLLAAERQAVEAGMPAGLRYVAGWPPRMPTQEEAERIVEARGVILGHHGLPVLFPTPQSVLDRFSGLIGLKEAA